jgi:hypothetical protein
LKSSYIVIKNAPVIDFSYLHVPLFKNSDDDDDDEQKEDDNNNMER